MLKYIPIDDALIGSLTVRETLSFAARLANLQLVIHPNPTIPSTICSMSL